MKYPNDKMKDLFETMKNLEEEMLLNTTEYRSTKLPSVSSLLLEEIIIS